MGSVRMVGPGLSNPFVTLAPTVLATRASTDALLLPAFRPRDAYTTVDAPGPLTRSSIPACSLPVTMKIASTRSRTRRTDAVVGVALALSLSCWHALPSPAFAAGVVGSGAAPGRSALQHIAPRVVKLSAALLFAWVARSLKQAGPAANPERHRAGQPIRCPWPFVLVALPWTALGRRSLKAGLCDWQTWVALSLWLLIL